MVDAITRRIARATIRERIKRAYRQCLGCGRLGCDRSACFTLRCMSCAIAMGIDKSVRCHRHREPGAPPPRMPA